MAIPEIYLNDIGVVFTFTFTRRGEAVNDLGAIVVLKFKGPNNVVFERAKPPIVYPSDFTDGKAEYTSVDGDFNQVGLWEIEGDINIPSLGFIGHTSIQTIRVLKPLSV